MSVIVYRGLHILPHEKRMNRSAKGRAFDIMRRSQKNASWFDDDHEEDVARGDGRRGRRATCACPPSDLPLSRSMVEPGEIVLEQRFAEEQCHHSFTSLRIRPNSLISDSVEESSPNRPGWWKPTPVVKQDDIDRVLQLLRSNKFAGVIDPEHHAHYLNPPEDIITTPKKNYENDTDNAVRRRQGSLSDFAIMLSNKMKNDGPPFGDEKAGSDTVELLLPTASTTSSSSSLEPTKEIAEVQQLDNRQRQK